MLTMLLAFSGIVLGLIAWPLQRRESRAGDLLLILATVLLVAAVASIVVAYGLFLLVLAVVPAVLFDDQPWKGIAIGNLIAHVVTGFAWTMTPTRLSRTIRAIGINIWLLTVIVTQVLIVILIVMAIF